MWLGNEELVMGGRERVRPRLSSTREVGAGRKTCWLLSGWRLTLGWLQVPVFCEKDS